MKWGIAIPEQRKVLGQLHVSEVLTKESKEAGGAPFFEMQNMIRDAIEMRAFRNDLPAELALKTFGALADATMDLMVLHPADAKRYRESGFQLYWAALTKQ